MDDLVTRCPICRYRAGTANDRKARRAALASRRGRVIDYLSWVIGRTVRLYPTKEQAARLDEWFWIGTGVWNWALSQYLADDRDRLPAERSVLIGRLAGGGGED